MAKWHLPISKVASIPHVWEDYSTFTSSYFNKLICNLLKNTHLQQWLASTSFLSSKLYFSFTTILIEEVLLFFSCVKFHRNFFISPPPTKKKKKQTRGHQPIVLSLFPLNSSATFSMYPMVHITTKSVNLLVLIPSSTKKNMPLPLQQGLGMSSLQDI